MANFVFDGTQNVTLTAGSGFDPATDKVSIANKVLVGATYTPSPGLTTGTILFTAADGATLTLNNVTPEILTAGTTLTSPSGTVALGNTTAPSTLNGNLSIGFGQADTLTTLAGVGGTDFGGVGSNLINGAAGTVGQLIYGGTGITDTVDAADSIAGSQFADTIYGNGGNDVIAGGDGGDQISGGAGNDTIAGPDTIFGAITGNFTLGAVLSGATGDDSIDATGSTDGITIFGGAGINDSADVADTLTGGSGADTIYGNGGDDVIAGGGGADSINGGAGNDTISGNFDSPTAGVSSTATIFGATGTDSITSTGAQGATIFGGSGINDSADGADTITGGAGADTIYGNGGDDVIAGGGGADSINGGAGNDTITGDFANPAASVSGAMIFGSAGSDVIDASTSTQGVTLFGGSGVTDSADGSDTILGGIGTLTATGNTVADSIFGNGGDDAILTNGGADVVNGGGGNDVIFDNGVGEAQLTGATGNDVFAFGATAAVGAIPADAYAGTVASHASITDFTQGSDLLDVGETVSSVLASTSVAALLGTSLGAGQVAYAADGSGNELVGYNNTGVAGAAANTFVGLTGSSVALTTADFTHGTATPVV
jgi:Ca2+-binding RTX toxin-like protein